jgi:hypothetical protein
MAIKFTNTFHCMTLENFPKFGFFGLKIYHLATLHLTAVNFKPGKRGSLLGPAQSRKSMVPLETHRFLPIFTPL